MDANELKKILRMFFIYQALESGWTVTKTPVHNTFEFTKSSDSSNKSTRKVFNSNRRSISDPIRHNCFV